jgi:TonB family protein
MKSATESVLWLVAAYGLACGVTQLGAQPSNAPTATSVGPRAVKVVLKQFAINQLASDPNTHHSLRTDGSWSISKNRPVTCSQVATACVEVFYEVPDQSAKCSWVISLDESGTEGKVLDENDDADSYMVRTLTGSEATSFVKSRSKPVVPPIGLAVHVSGTVVIQALVGKAGDVQKVLSVNGNPMLQRASIDAAKKWTFMPMTIGTRTVQYQVPLVFTFYPWIASMPGAIKTAP